MSALSVGLGLLPVLVSCGSPGRSNAGPPPQQPNIIVIMADDLGYGDLGCYGHPTLATPNLDHLAASGVRFTDYHSNGAVCSPTRAALLTGRYQQRSGISGVVTAKSHRHTGLDLEEVTFAEVLKDAGYATALFGKWHLGYAPEFNPVHQGFDQFTGFVSGNVDYHTHIDQVGEIDWWKQAQLVPEEGYSTDLISDHGVRFVEENKDRPFCLYLAHESPHSPYQGRADKAVRAPGNPRFAPGRKDRRAAHHEMIAALDDGVGRIVAAVEAAGIADRTLIFFCSDNGPSGPGSSGGLRGKKSQVWEGGHRVPAIAAWAGTIRAGTTNDQLILGMDLMPTMAAMAGAQLPADTQLDGVNLLPLLTEGRPMSARSVAWEFKGNMALRKGRWKLLRIRGKTQLFDLSRDRNEERDISADHPLLVESLSAELEAWYLSVTEGVEMRS